MYDMTIGVVVGFRVFFDQSNSPRRRMRYHALPFPSFFALLCTWYIPLYHLCAASFFFYDRIALLPIVCLPLSPSKPPASAQPCPLCTMVCECRAPPTYGPSRICLVVPQYHRQLRNPALCAWRYRCVLCFVRLPRSGRRALWRSRQGEHCMAFD